MVHDSIPQRMHLLQIFTDTRWLKSLGELIPRYPNSRALNSLWLKVNAIGEERVVQNSLPQRMQFLQITLTIVKKSE